MCFSNNLFKYAFVVFILSFFTGCIHKIDKQGLTLSLSEYQLTQSFKSSFPLKKDFLLGNLQIETPNIEIPKYSKKINATIDFSIDSLLTPKENGAIQISGTPIFNKENSAIYLTDIQLKRAYFANFDTNNTKAKTFLSMLQPIINNTFKKLPIYKIDKNSFQGTFVKNIKIEDESLLITFGI